MTDKERNELAYNAFWCEYEKSQKQELSMGGLSIRGGWITASSKFESFWFFTVFKCEVKGYIGDFEFKFENDKEKYNKVKSIIAAKRDLKQQERDNLLLSMQCNNENKTIKESKK